MPEFVGQILHYKDDGNQQSNIGSQIEQKPGQALKNVKINSGKELIAELQKLFAAMCIGNKKYLDPSAVLTSIVDDVGEKFKVGEEKDMQEFNDLFLQRI